MDGTTNLTKPALLEWWVSQWRPVYYDIQRIKHIRPYENMYVPGVSEMEVWMTARYDNIYHVLTEWGGWTLSILAVLVYLPLIFGLQRLMRTRRPWDLRRALVLWNGGLALFSALTVLRVAPEFVDHFFTHGLSERAVYESICSFRHSAGAPAVWVFFFTVSKLFELGDTMFIVLRKRPLIFLHYFHHAVTLLYNAYTIVDWNSGARWFVVMNALVHTFMYAYFAVKAAGGRVPRAISMFITATQLMQMFVGSFVAYKTIRYLNQGIPCGAEYRNVFICLTMYGLYVLLFGHFFYKAYVHEDSSKRGRATKVEGPPPVQTGQNGSTAALAVAKGVRFRGGGPVRNGASS